MQKTKRPLAITIICITGLIGALTVVPLIFSDIAQQIGPWYPPYLALSAVIGLGCMIGLWLMKKIAAYTYTGFFAINQVVLLVMGLWNPLALLIPGVVVAVALYYSGDMGITIRIS